MYINNKIETAGIVLTQGLIIINSESIFFIHFDKLFYLN